MIDKVSGGRVCVLKETTGKEGISGLVITWHKGISQDYTRMIAGKTFSKVGRYIP